MRILLMSRNAPDAVRARTHARQERRIWRTDNIISLKGVSEMALKDEWKETGKGLGGAFKDLGTNVGRSVKSGLDPSDDNQTNVFNDGSWRKTGKELGGAFKGLAKSMVDSAKAGIDKIDGGDKKEETK